MRPQQARDCRGAHGASPGLQHSLVKAVKHPRRRPAPLHEYAGPLSWGGELLWMLPASSGLRRLHWAGGGYVGSGVGLGSLSAEARAGYV
ncbi:MAG: hypothetical protein DRJ96_10160 [Thermoprotei archaeon]|nr:MAG: hypothetical protein DRJ96_10160 [Thermoprotei archaeon]